MLYTSCMKRRTPGFTIVEILIIIVVIGILAAIAVLSYNGVQQQAREAGLKSDFETAAARIERYRSDKGEYPPVTGGVDTNLVVANIEMQKSLYASNTDNFLYCVSPDGQQFGFAGESTTNLTYVYGTNREFGRYTAHIIANGSAICDALTGVNSGYRFGYIAASGWRTWSQ